MSYLDDILSWLTGTEEETPERDLKVLGGEALALLPLPLVVCNKKLSILATNQAFGRHFQVQGKGVRNRNLFDLLGEHIKIIDEDGRERPVTRSVEILNGKNPTILSGRFRGIGDRVFYAFHRVVPTNGKGQLLILLQDVTKDKELQGMIGNSRRELLSVFDGIEDPMAMIDKDFRIRRINEAMLKAVGGRAYKDFIGKACWFKLHGRSDRCPGCTAGETLATGKKAVRHGLLERRPDPEEVTYQITCYPLRDTSGAVTGVAESYHDMTEVARMEERLYESERVRVMQPLAAGIAHEVRNPLAVIQSTAQYCMGESGNRELKEGLQAILASTASANRVVQDLLDFAKPQEVNFKRQSLKPILQEGLALMKGRAKDQKVTLSLSAPRNLPVLIIDKDRFLQAIINFLINSLDAMPAGGRLTVEARGRRSDQTVEVVIRDTGEGVPEEVVHRVFQPFFSTKNNGVGLGLSIAEGIIRSHGGQVRFKSWAGKGSEVTIKLPMRRAQNE